MNTEDRALTKAEIRQLSSADELARFFLNLGYDIEERMPQPPEALGITAKNLLMHIDHVELLARHADEFDVLYVYLFEMKSVRVTDRQALARVFRDRSGDFLLVITDDYSRLDFVLMERVLPELEQQSVFGVVPKVKVRPRVLTVAPRDPDPVALRVLRRFTVTHVDVDYQLDKLRSAYTVAEWSEPMFNNRGLFADHYLNVRLRDAGEWQEKPLPVYEKLRALMVKARERLSDEAATRAELLEPAFEALGFDAQHSEDGDNAADYTLYVAGSDQPLALCLAYTWNRYLDGRIPQPVPDRDSRDNRDENPGAKIVSLLESGEVPYVILTNGKLWRLYATRAHSRATNYYEIDLEEALSSPDRDQTIKYFWLFFRAAAFEPVEVIRDGEPRRMCFIDRVMEGSADYAKQVGDRLKDKVFEEIFPHFARGFIEYIRQQQGKNAPIDQNRLDAIYQGTLTFLYRLMFLLYAEARDLLPINDARGYAEISLKRLKSEIAEVARNIEDEAPKFIGNKYRSDTTELYDRLAQLFEVIDQGDASYNVPRYNGGLFITQPREDDTSQEAANARFLLDTKIPDRHLALGLDRLARDRDDKRHGLVMIDFKALGVRQLGSIYEGLLEFKLRIADQPMAVIRDKSAERVIPKTEVKKQKVIEELPEGAVYLENTRQERKATGSYYTPDYIVKYIVAHTVGPVLDEKFEALRPRLHEVARQYRRAADRAKAKSEDLELFWINPDRADVQRLAYDVLDIKVLDPAMGSGHFLVEVVDFVADRMISFLDGFLRNPVVASLQQTRASILDAMEEQRVSIDAKRLNDVALLKRQVLKRCVYGVDLNPMAVELAKVSLWLDAFTLGAPLSFLDHHLRCGNSLIGAMARDADVELRGELPLFGGPFAGLLRSAEVMRGIGALSDATIDQVHESADLFHAFEEAARPYKQLLDVFVIRHFGVVRADEYLRQYGLEVESGNTERARKLYDEVLAERARLYGQYRFFHWDLEFPEVFIDLEHADWKADGGFDAVVGNPPYVRQEELSPLKPYLSEQYAVYQGTADLYLYFYERGLSLLQQNHRLGFITSGTFMNSNSSKAFRQFIHEEAGFEHVINFGENQPFEGAEMVYPTVAVVRNGPPDETFRSLYIEGTTIPTDLPKAMDEIGIDCLSEVTGNSEWRFQAAELTRLFKKITEGYVTLGEKVDGRMYRGITTGLNDAFIIDADTRNRLLLHEDDSSAEIIKPTLRGQDLRPWYQLTNGLHLLWSYQGIEIDNYIAVKKYLEQFKTALASRWEPSRGQCEWYELRPCDYYAEFEKPKIVWPDISKLPRFSLNENSYLVNTGFMIGASKKWFLGLLQSRVLWFAISQIAQPLRLRAGLWQYRVLPQYVERLPIPELTPLQEAELSQIVEQITALARERYALHEAVREHIVAELSGGGKLNTKLTEWWDLDGIDDLRDEARKAFKRAIPANKHGEWGRLLAAKQEEHAQLTAQIVKLETRMNAVVCEAFDLTPEEIALIEETTKYPYGAV